MSEMHKLLATSTSLLLAFSLAACGGSGAPAATTNTDGSSTVEQTVDQSTTSEAETEQEAAGFIAPATHDALIDPSDINPGWISDSDNTSDFWWPNGDQSASECLYFTNAANDAGTNVTFVDAEGIEDSIWDLVIEDGHLATAADAADRRQVDITFQDNFTCYDSVTDTFYVRGNKSEADYQALIEGMAFAADVDNPEKWMLSFNEGGELVQTYRGEPTYGTWVVQTPNVVYITLSTDSSSWDDEYQLVFEGEDVVALSDGHSNYPAV